MKCTTFPRAENAVAGTIAHEDSGWWFNDSHQPLVFSGGRAHLLKCRPPHFGNVAQGKKPFELRYNDRGYCEGDYLVLREFEDDHFSGEVCVVRMGYVLRQHDGLERDWVVMTIRALPWAEQSRVLEAVGTKQQWIGGGLVMVKRYSPETWKGDALQAAGMSAGACAHGGTVGIDMVAQDGTVFAHGHFDIHIAEQFRDLLTQAIAEAKARMN